MGGKYSGKPTVSEPQSSRPSVSLDKSLPSPHVGLNPWTLKAKGAHLEGQHRDREGMRIQFNMVQDGEKFRVKFRGLEVF